MKMPSTCGWFLLLLLVLKRSSSLAPRIVWFRDHALRTLDNESLTAAVEKPTIPVFLWNGSRTSKGGTASDVFLSRALESLNQTLSGRLIVGMIKEDTPGAFVQELAYMSQQTTATEIYYMQSPYRQDEDDISSLMKQHGLGPNGYSGTNLMDYRKHPAPPLIPFVDYVRHTLDGNPPPVPLSQPSLDSILSPKAISIVQNSVTIEELK